MFTREQIQKALEKKGYSYFVDGDWNMNIIGIRNTQTNAVTNMFDDLITLSYKENGEWKFYSWPATTDPGRKAMLESKNSKGVAILVPGQYRSSHSLGLHQGKYEALRQVRPVKVYRDSNKDLKYDQLKVDEGLFGINIHKAGVDSTLVDTWSEGCQVFKRTKDFNEFMKLVKKAGKTFTYTLIESKDI
jgi:hypothetical protein